MTGLIDPWSGLLVTGGGVSYDAATTAWVNAVVAAGGAVSATQKGYVDTLIVALKAHSLFSIIDALWLHGGESDAKQATIDIVNLHAATVNGTVTLAAGGYTGNGTTGYINTGINTSTLGGNYTRNSASFGTYIRTSRTTSSAFCAIGAFQTSDVRFYGRSVLSNILYSVNQGGVDQVANANAQGSYVASRTASNANAVYRNGSSLATNTDASSALSPSNMFLFAYSASGTPTDLSTDQHAASFIAGGFDATQAANFSSDLNAYMTSWGINVY